MSNGPNQPNTPADPEPEKPPGQKEGDPANVEKQEETEEFLPAPLPERQRETAEKWLRPPGQSSG